MSTSKRSITLHLANDEKITVDAYTTASDGLVVHREHRYSPSKKAHRATSKWTVSHAKSGKTILLPAQMFETKMEAMALCEQLAEIDWQNSPDHELDESSIWEKVQDGVSKVSNENFDGDLDRSRHSIDDLAQELDYDGKFGMRTVGRGRERIYEIYDKETDEVKERLSLPGRATERLTELNNEGGE